MMTMKFFINLCKKILRNESNLIESFELFRILNSLKFLNYLILTRYKDIRYMSHFTYIFLISYYCIQCGTLPHI